MRVLVESMAHGGEGVARVDGQVVFVAGAIPGDTVEIEITENRGRFARARAVQVVDPSTGRRVAPCLHADVCGGCAWQMAPVDTQRRWKRITVADQLQRIGRFDLEPDPVVAGGSEFHYRNRLDLRVAGGRPAMFGRRSHRLVPLDTCLLPVIPLADAFSRISDWSGVGRVTLRWGSTGEAVAIVDRLPAKAWPVPASKARAAMVHHEVAGRRLRVSGRSFFQVNNEAAGLLVDLVGGAVGGGDLLADLYAGGGLFGATVGSTFRKVVGVESNPTSVRDALVNAPDMEMVQLPVAESADRFREAEAIVADPPRTGLGGEVVDALAASRATRLAYVSCDPGSFARDARGLVDSGFRLERVTPVDMFPQTWHVELVGVFRR